MLAMKFDIPFVVINSINREYSQRTDFKPHISDLRNSGQLEFDADLVLLLHRPSVFREPKNGENKEEFEHLANLIIAKNRLGEANIELDYHFDGERGRFKEMEKKHAV
jgi:replicative DNA helicase